MKQKRYSNEQIVYALKRVDGGEKAADVCREMGISEATFYYWRKRFAGMGVSELGRLKQLEEENNRLRAYETPFTWHAFMPRARIRSTTLQSLLSAAKSRGIRSIHLSRSRYGQRHGEEFAQRQFTV